MPTTPAVVGRNLRRLRASRGIAASELARRSGLARATLTELEAGRGNPTLETLETLAGELNTTVPELVAVADTDAVTVVRAGEGARKRNGAMDARLVQRTAGAGAVLEVWLVEVHPGHQDAPAHPPGVVEQLFVLGGRLTAGPAHGPVELASGDYLSFAGDQPHLYRVADGPPARVLIVMIYPGAGGGRGMISHDLAEPSGSAPRQRPDRTG